MYLSPPLIYFLSQSLSLPPLPSLYFCSSLSHSVFLSLPLYLTLLVSLSFSLLLLSLSLSLSILLSLSLSLCLCLSLFLAFDLSHSLILGRFPYLDQLLSFFIHTCWWPVKSCLETHTVDQIRKSWVQTRTPLDVLSANNEKSYKSNGIIEKRSGGEREGKKGNIEIK